jgi:hypothetical protein
LAHNIVFREPKDELYAKYPWALPADSWYSTNPYIDAQVRKARFEHIVVALHKAGFPVGAWACRVIEDVKLNRDPNRAGSQNQVVNNAHPNEAVADNVLANDGNTTRLSDRKRAAEPPLYGAAGQAPRVVRELDLHTIVFYNGWFYGVPRALGDMDLSNGDPSQVAGVVKDTSEERVMQIIEDASYWANTRGQYDSQQKQRTSGSYLRAGSVVGEGTVSRLPENRSMVIHKGEYIAVDRQALREAIGEYEEEETRLLSVVTKGALPELMWALDGYNLVKYDGVFYGLPHGIPIDWDAGDMSSIPGLYSGPTVKDVLAKIDATRKNKEASTPVRSGPESLGSGPVSEAFSTPRLLETLHGYNVVSYEGWIYGIPQSFGPIDLTEVDVMEMPGIIRDVSRDVVENEVIDRAKTRQQATV